MPRRLLIISAGPLPLPEHPHVEGGGLRCWELARGLRQHLPDLQIELAFLENFRRPPFTEHFEGFPFRTWNLQSIPALVAGFDSVLISYCLGDVSLRVVESLSLEQQLILDCYVPVYVETSARETSDLDREYGGFLSDVRNWNRVLSRGDLFLCADDNQERYFQGVLSALGRINPVTYRSRMILKVPYGIHRDEPVARDTPITRLVGSTFAHKILWFGGIYPWFDLCHLLDAVPLVNRAIPARLIVVGAKNPFSIHPDFLAKYRTFVEYASQSQFRDVVFMHDWVSFCDRADWYLDADVLVHVSNPGDENALSWRTRLADATWAQVPIVTSGGDPLGESLIAAGAAVRLSGLSPRAIAKTLVDVLLDGEVRDRCRAKLGEFKQGLFWDVVTQPLSDRVREGTLAPDIRRIVVEAPPAEVSPAQVPSAQMPFVEEPVQRQPLDVGAFARKVRKIPPQLLDPGVGATLRKIRKQLGEFELPLVPAGKRVVRSVVKAAGHIRPNGAHDAAGTAGARSRTSEEPARPAPLSRKPGLVILAHQLDLSGAPFVLVDFLAELARTDLRHGVTLWSYAPVHDTIQTFLDRLGWRVMVLFERTQIPELVEGDVLLVNSGGITAQARDRILDAAESGRLTRLLWFVHEDVPERYFGEVRDRLARLAADHRLLLLASASQTRANYALFLGTEPVHQPYGFEIPSEYQGAREPEDFDVLRFANFGTVTDGRKGQLPILYAFAAFYSSYFSKDSPSYREFTLSFIGVEYDFLSQQIRQHQSILGNRVMLHPKVPRDHGLRIMCDANMTICYSLSECLPLSVFEGMLSGHPILRNDCSGLSEQLEEGVNGYKIESGDFWQMVATLERVLNRRKTSNQTLAEMSKRSVAIARRHQGDWRDTLIALLMSTKSDQFESQPDRRSAPATPAATAASTSS